MRRFNLIDEKWIPVRFPGGNHDELGIRDTILQAGEIATMEDPSPPVLAALHRFLLAVLYRALEGPSDISQAKEIFRTGFPEGKIVAYLEKWRDRFWLFDADYPFGQNPNVSKSELEPWTKLTAEYNATSNKVLFDHTDTRQPGSRPANECARWLLSTMNFSIAGGRGYYPSPSPNAIMCIPLGRNLHQTLCYLLVPYPNRDVMRGDSALWEREPAVLPLDPPKRTSTGYADLYTWPSRMLLLEEEASGEVARMRFVAGQGFENAAKSPDPMQPYKTVKNQGNLPVQFRENRGTWRDFDSLLPDGGELAPMTVQNAVRLAANDPDILPESLLVLGLRYEPPRANVDFWRMERFAMPRALAGNRFFRTEIYQLLTVAEDAQKSLWLACRNFARDLLSRGSRDPAGKDISNFVDQMPVISWYWSSLEMRFHEILREYGTNPVYDEIRRRWLGYVRDSLQEGWDQHRTAVFRGDTWTIRALAKSEVPLRRKLRELNEEIKKLDPQKEDS